MSEQLVESGLQTFSVGDLAVTVFIDRVAGSDGGMTIMVHDPKGKRREYPADGPSDLDIRGRELLRFDAFRKKPHYHVFDPDGGQEYHVLGVDEGQTPREAALAIISNGGEIYELLAEVEDFEAVGMVDMNEFTRVAKQIEDSVFALS